MLPDSLPTRRNSRCTSCPNVGRRGAGNEADVCFCRIVIISGVSIERDRERPCCPLHPFRTNILFMLMYAQILISLRPDNLKNNSKDMTDVKVKTVEKAAALP